MGRRADVIVHGATGFTGRLVSAALAKRGIAFDVAGRSADKLARLRDAHGAEACVVDLADPDSIKRAFEGRKLVCACAGPFAAVGEAPLATCARLGVHYVDTTGEQAFVARALTRYRATAEASRACVVPAMAYEIAFADWASHLAVERLGEAPEGIDILYATRGAASATRGTKRSALEQIARGEAMQFVDGALVREPAAAVVRGFPVAGGHTLTGASFPSPESVVVPGHTGARTVRTFMGMPPARARLLRAARGLLPSVVRTFSPMIERSIGRAAEGPDETTRNGSTFEVVVEAHKGDRRAAVHLMGKDPYGLTAEIQAYAASCVVAGKVTARGVVAPSVAYDPRDALAAMASFGVTVTES